MLICTTSGGRGREGGTSVHRQLQPLEEARERGGDGGVLGGGALLGRVHAVRVHHEELARAQQPVLGPVLVAVLVADLHRGTASYTVLNSLFLTSI